MNYDKVGDPDRRLLDHISALGPAHGSGGSVSRRSATVSGSRSERAPTTTLSNGPTSVTGSQTDSVGLCRSVADQARYFHVVSTAAQPTPSSSRHMLRRRMSAERQEQSASRVTQTRLLCCCVGMRRTWCCPSRTGALWFRLCGCGRNRHADNAERGLNAAYMDACSLTLAICSTASTDVFLGNPRACRKLRLWSS